MAYHSGNTFDTSGPPPELGPLPPKTKPGGSILFVAVRVDSPEEIMRLRRAVADVERRESYWPHFALREAEALTANDLGRLRHYFGDDWPASIGIEGSAASG